MHTGLDAGLKTTAIVTIDDNGKVIHRAQFGTAFKGVLKDLRKAHQVERFNGYYDKIDKYLIKHAITGTLVIEQPSGAAIGNGRLLLVLYGAYLICAAKHFPYYKIFLPQPTAVKKSFTGSGRSDKNTMLSYAQKCGFNPRSHHEADAYAMAQMSLKGNI